MVDKSVDLYLRFERLVAEIFRAEGFGAQVEPHHVRRGADIYLTSRSNASAAVEVKLFRTRRLSFEILLQMCAQAESARTMLMADWAVLAISVRIPSDQKRILREQNARLIIYDFDSLKFIAARHPRLIAELEAIVREAMISQEDISERDSVDLVSISEIESVPQVAEGEPEEDGPAELPSAARNGHHICSDLHNTPAGRKGWKDFEKWTEEALRYSSRLTLLLGIRKSEPNLECPKYDIVARVISQHDLWAMVRERFQSQYVIFECKNFSEKIKQGEIYTTEKYLHLKALRSVAFIVSRFGPDENGSNAASGALREHGKLIVNLTVDDLCKMLDLKDQVGDYNGYLFGIIDDMLLRLER